MIVARTADEVRAVAPGPVTFVPTMGALHAGHASLVRLGCSFGDPVVVSDFVNPTQFGPGEDFERYPRDLSADAELAEVAGAAVLYAPAVEEIYPLGFATTVDPGPLGDELCGASRPDHFVGVATVVTRLFGLVAPTRAIFGRKDYQQLVLIQRVTRDLALGVDVLGAPTVREDDGLALSSRNRYLAPDERARAAAVPGLLRHVAGLYADGERDPGALRAVCAQAPFTVEYLEIRAADLTEYDPTTPAVVLLACRIGGTRLIDNVELDPHDPGAGLRALAIKEIA